MIKNLLTLKDKLIDKKYYLLWLAIGVIVGIAISFLPALFTDSITGKQAWSHPEASLSYTPVENVAISFSSNNISDDQPTLETYRFIDLTTNQQIMTLELQAGEISQELVDFNNEYAGYNGATSAVSLDETEKLGEITWKDNEKSQENIEVRRIKSRNELLETTYSNLLLFTIDEESADKYYSGKEIYSLEGRIYTDSSVEVTEIINGLQLESKQK